VAARAQKLAPLRAGGGGNDTKNYRNGCAKQKQHVFIDKRFSMLLHLLIAPLHRSMADEI
jgi:hypothetical protein